MIIDERKEISQQKREKLFCLECHSELVWDPNEYRLIAPYLRSVECEVCQFEHYVLDGNLVGDNERKQYTAVKLVGDTYTWKEGDVEQQASIRCAGLLIKAIYLGNGYRMWPDEYNVIEEMA